MYVFIDAVSYTESNSFIVCAVACDLLCPPDPSSILSQWWGGYPSCVLTRREGVAFPGPGRCVSIFLNQNRCHAGKSQSEQPPKRTPRPPPHRQEPRRLHRGGEIDPTHIREPHKMKQRDGALVRDTGGGGGSGVVSVRTQ
jgi:hypothetical protein